MTLNNTFKLYQLLFFIFPGLSLYSAGIFM